MGVRFGIRFLPIASCNARRLRNGPRIRILVYPSSRLCIHQFYAVLPTVTNIFPKPIQNWPSQKRRFSRSLEGDLFNLRLPIRLPRQASSNIHAGTGTLGQLASEVLNMTFVYAWSVPTSLCVSSRLAFLIPIGAS